MLERTDRNIQGVNRSNHIKHQLWHTEVLPGWLQPPGGMRGDGKHFLLCRLIRTMVLNTDMMYHIHLVSSLDTTRRIDSLPSRRLSGIKSASFTASLAEQVRAAGAAVVGSSSLQNVQSSLSKGNPPEQATNAFQSDSYHVPSHPHNAQPASGPGVPAKLSTPGVFPTSVVQHVQWMLI